MAAHPSLTLQDPYSVLPVKIQFMTSSRWPGCCLSLSVWLWLKHSLKHSQAWLPCWWKSPAVGQTWTRRIGRTVCICSRPPDSLFHFAALSALILTHTLKNLFFTVISDYFSCVNWFPFLSLLSVGNHLGAMVHQRWAEHTHISLSLHFNALWMYSFHLICAPVK